MSDLRTQIRDHYRAMAAPITTEEILERADRDAVVRGHKRRRPAWTAIAVAASAVLVLGLVPLVNYVAMTLVPTEPAASTTMTTLFASPQPSTTTTVSPEVWETELGPPAKTDQVAAQWSFRAEIGTEGASGRPGVSSRPLLRSVDGYYWRFQAGDRNRSSPAGFGETVVVGSDDGNLYGLSVTSGPPALWSVETGGEVVGAPIIAEVTAPGAGPDSTDTEMRVFFGSTDGRMRSRDVSQATAAALSFPPLGEPALAAIESAPLVMDDRVFFGTEAGEVWALDAATLEPIWPEPSQAGGSVTVAPLGASGVVYVVTDTGRVWAIDAVTGVGSLCHETNRPVSDPLIAGDLMLIPTDARWIDVVRVGSCEPVSSLMVDGGNTSSPAVEEGIVYVGNGSYLEARDLNLNQTIWRFPGADAVGGLGGAVRWPVVVEGAVYFTSSDGWLFAVDKQGGTELWRYNLGAESVTSPAPGTGVVFVADVSGTLHAIGCENPPECG